MNHRPALVVDASAARGLPADEELRSHYARLAGSRNVLVLVDDWAAADLWIDQADRIVGDEDGPPPVVAELQDGHVGLVVAVGSPETLGLALQKS